VLRNRCYPSFRSPVSIIPKCRSASSLNRFHLAPDSPDRSSVAGLSDIRGPKPTSGDESLCRERHARRGFLVPSFEMKLPGAERAVVDFEKLRDYCLNSAHPRGRHKARVFAAALRLQQEDAEWLKAQLLDAALGGDAKEVDEDEYGRRYLLDFKCVRHQKCVTVRSGWMVRRGENFPRLTTCYVLSNEACHD
jgi:hypothetical protein